MKYLILSVLMAGTAVLSQRAIADDSPAARPNQTDQQLMKQCMSERKAANPSASPDDIKKACQQQVKSYRDHPSVTSPEAAPKP